MNSNNPFAVLDGGADNWRKVGPRRRRKKTAPAKRPKPPKPTNEMVALSSSKLFIKEMQNQYSSKFKEANIAKVCEQILSEVHESSLTNPSERELLKARIFEMLGFLEQSALFEKLTTPQAQEEKEVLPPVVVPENPLAEVQVPEIPTEVVVEEPEDAEEEEDEEEGEEYWGSPTEDDPAESLSEDEEKEDNENKKEDESYEEESGGGVESSDDVQEEEEERDPTPVEKTLAQKLAEQAKTMDLTSIHSCQLVAEWSRCINNPGDLGVEYRSAFNQSNVLRTIVKALLTVSPNEVVRAAEETVGLFHNILQGSAEYHRWLYNQIRTLADNISKTSRRMSPEWFTFICNQAFALVDAQKDRKINPESSSSKVVYKLPSTYVTMENDEWLKMQWEWADTHCQDMYCSIEKLQSKDEELLTMSPMSSSNFQQRYNQVQTHLEQKISKAQANVSSQKSRLDKIKESLEINEVKTKELLKPMEHKLREVQHDVEQTKNEILEYESRLKTAREKLGKLESSETQLQDEIAQVHATHVPQREELVKQRTNFQFKLHDAHLEQDCYTQLRHIAHESFKHLQAWSQCNITQETESRRRLLQIFYQSVEKYACTLISMLHFLGQRVGFMQQALERNQSEANQMKKMYGQSNSEMDERIKADRRKMEADSKVLAKLQDEVNDIVQKSLQAAMKWRGFEDAFNALWHNIEAIASRYKVNINTFVKLKVPQHQSVVTPPQQLNNRMANSQHPMYAQHPRHMIGPQSGSQQSGTNFQGSGNAGVQPATEKHKVHKFQNPAVSPVAQAASHLTQPTQTVPAAHSQPIVQPPSTSPHESWQPLKIINNTTDKNYELQQNIGGHYQNQPQAETSSQPRPTKPPVTKNYKNAGAGSSVQGPQQVVGNAAQAYRRRPPAPPTQPPPQTAVGNAMHGFGRMRPPTDLARTTQAKPSTNYWGRQSN